MMFASTFACAPYGDIAYGVNVALVAVTPAPAAIVFASVAQNRVAVAVDNRSVAALLQSRAYVAQEVRVAAAAAVFVAPSDDSPRVFG